MYDIPANSLEPIKRQEKELKLFYDSASSPSDIGTVQEVLEVYDDSSGIMMLESVFYTNNKHKYIMIIFLSNL